MIKWGFPTNQNSLINGLNSAGVETFKKGRIESLGKEICQNSMDAIMDDTNPVKVQFSVFSLDYDSFPGTNDIKDMYIKQIKFWEKYQINDKRVPEFFKKAKKLLSKKKIKCLRISDFNTTGLTGSDKILSSNWSNLVKATAVSDKPGTSGGSFGIGKFASFVASDLYMVFFSTLDVNGMEAFQGVTRLSSFIDDDNETYQGVGFYGDENKFAPIRECLSLDPNFKRQEPGTDLYIIGLIKEEDWKDKLISCMLDNFLFSFFYNKLSVDIDGTTISKDNISKVIKAYKEKELLSQYTLDYYDVYMKDSKQLFRTKIIEDNDVNLTLRVAKNQNRKVAIIRKNGMKIFDKGHISNRTSFSGVLYLSGDKVNKFFKSMENPAHDSWDIERHTDKNEAYRKRQMLFGFIKEKLNSMIEERRPDKIDAEGVGEFLPDFSEANNPENEVETISDVIINQLEVKKRKTTQKAKRKDTSGEEIIDTPLLGEIDDNGDVEVKVPGSRKPSGEGEINPGRDTDKGSLNDNGENEVITRLQVYNATYRLIKNKDYYEIIIRSKYTIQNTELKLYKSGETIKERLTIVNASLNNKELVIKNNYIKLGKIYKDAAYKIKFTINEVSNLPMEGSLYEVK